MLTRIIIALVMTVSLLFIDITGWIRLALYLVVYLIIGYDILKRRGLGLFTVGCLMRISLWPLQLWVLSHLQYMKKVVIIWKQ